MHDVEILLRGLSRRLLLYLALFAVGQTCAQAAASDWEGDQRSEVRLVTATDGVQGRVLQAGLEFRYRDGWHGYWRTPGDTGIAPVMT